MTTEWYTFHEGEVQVLLVVLLGYFSQNEGVKISTPVPPSLSVTLNGVYVSPSPLIFVHNTTNPGGQVEFESRGCWVRSGKERFPRRRRLGVELFTTVEGGRRVRSLDPVRTVAREDVTWGI